MYWAIHVQTNILCFAFLFDFFSDLLLVVIFILLISTWCLSVSAARLCGMFGADGMWGEQNNQPLQTNTNAYCCLRRPLPLCGMVHSSRSRHQQAGQLDGIIEYSLQQFFENVSLSNFAVQPSHEVCAANLFCVLSGPSGWGSNSQGGSVRQLGLYAGTPVSRRQVEVSIHYNLSGALTGGVFVITDTKLSPLCIVTLGDWTS